MDKKTLLIIFTCVSLAIIIGFMYRKYKSLTDEISRLKEQLEASQSKEISNSSHDNEETDNDVEGFSTNSSIDMVNIEHNGYNNNPNNNYSNIEGLPRDNASIDDDSIIRARKEVTLLQQELQNVEGLIQDSESNQTYHTDNDNDNAVTHAQENDMTITNNDPNREQGITDNQVHSGEHIVQDTHELSGNHLTSVDHFTSAEQNISLVPLYNTKNNMSEFEDLANVPSDENSELNQLIHKESQIDIGINHNITLDEIRSNNNMTSFNNLSLNDIKEDYASEMSKNINMKSSDDKEDVELTITLDLIIKNFSNKQLKDICRDNNLPIGGPKVKLINRIIDNDLGYLLNNTPIELNQSELLQ